MAKVIINDKEETYEDGTRLVDSTRMILCLKSIREVLLS